MKNPLRYIKDILDPQTAIEDGWAYKHPKPKLSDKKRKELMENSSLETPRSTTRAILGILTPYWTKSSPKERIAGVALLATSLAMTWYSVQMTVEFGNWLSGLTNTVQQLYQTMMTTKPDIVNDVVNHYPSLHDFLAHHDTLNQILSQFPDTTSMLYDPGLADIIQNNPGLTDLLQKNPTIEEVFMQFPSFADQVHQNPDLLHQLTAFKHEVGQQISSQPSIKNHLDNLWALSGGDFITNWGHALKSSFNVAADFAKNQTFDGASLKNAWSSAWHSKDLATIALKFTAMAIISYKSAQYLALRWRAWTTGYFTNKWMNSKAYSRLKNTFNNIDNPGQRIQEDPSKFTAGAVSIMTGVAHSGIQIASFGGMLWGMGQLMGVPHGIFWLGVSYASALTALTVGAGRKLPWIQRNQQRREADLRTALDKVHNNADVIAQNDGENIENDLAKKRFKPVMKNSVREIGTQVKLIIVDATAGNLSIPIPWVAGAFAVATGAASMGTIQTINYAFNRVTSAMSFIVNNFNSLSQMKATADRIHMFDTAVDAAHYIEEEKRLAAEQVKPAALLPEADDDAGNLPMLPPPSTPPSEMRPGL